MYNRARKTGLAQYPRASVGYPTNYPATVAIKSAGAVLAAYSRRADVVEWLLAGTRQTAAAQHHPAATTRPQASTYTTHTHTHTHTHTDTVAPPDGGKGEASPYGWTSKNYVICVCVMNVRKDR